MALHKHRKAARTLFAYDGSASARRVPTHSVTLSRDGGEFGLVYVIQRGERAADRRGYDTIVVGRRNEHEASLILLGSVSQQVVSGAPGDVVVVA